VGFAERSFDEASHAREVARHLRTDHHELTLEPSMLLDLIPHCRRCSTTAGRRIDHPISAVRVHAPAREGCPWRDGGDELFAGYPTLQAHRLAGYYLRAPGVLRRLVEPMVRRLPVSRDNLSFDYRPSDS